MAAPTLNPVIPRLAGWIAHHQRNASFVARALGVSPSTVKRWLDGTRNPSAEACRSLDRFIRKRGA